ANAIEEVLEMQSVEVLLAGGTVGGLDAVAHLPAAIIEDQDAVLTVQRDAPRLALEAGPRPDAMLPDHGAIGEVERGDLRVRSFLIILIEELAAAGRDADRGIEIEQPAGEIESMDAVVAYLAGAVIPVPVPLVMEPILIEGPLWCGTEPKAVIDALG